MTQDDSSDVVIPFRQIHCVLTERCQLRCRHCAIAWEPLLRQSQELGTNDILDVIRFAVSKGASEVILSGGEPFVRRDLITLARSVLSLGVVCVVATNGLNIPERTITELANLQNEYSRLRIRISLDGASAKTHDLLRGTDSFSRTLSTINKLLESGVIIQGINTVLTKSNYQELDQLLSIAQHFKVKDLTLLDLLLFGRASDLNSLRLDYDEWQSVLSFQSLKQHDADLWINVRGPLDRELISQFGFQYAPISFDTLYLEPDGSLVLCYPFQSHQRKCKLSEETLECRWDKVLQNRDYMGTTKCIKCPLRSLCHGVV